MKLKVEDGKTIFATHLIRFTQPEEYDYKFHEELVRCYQLEPEGFVAYDFDEAQLIVEDLKMCGICDAVIEDIIIPSTYIDKVKDVKYASRTEALKHLIENVEPESMITPNLKKKLQEKEDRIVQLTNELNLLKQKHALFEERINKLEKGAKG
jgi:hypothetical protein